MTSTTTDTTAEPTTKRWEDLTPEVQDVMNKAVRKSRNNYWCQIFDEVAPEIFGVGPNDVVDSDGRSCRGLDREGFDINGFDRSGFNREGFDSEGFNARGYDANGFDRSGFNEAGLNAAGDDRYCFDRNGHDREGFNRNGFRIGERRQWFIRQAARPAEDFLFDRHGYPRPTKKN